MNQQNSDADIKSINSQPLPPHSPNIVKTVNPQEITSRSQEHESTQSARIPVNEPSKDQLVPVIKKIHKEESTNLKRNRGHWTIEEQQAYIDFLQQNQQLSMQQEYKKIAKMFKMMSQTIGTRSPSQCKSHHQKLNPNTRAGQKKIKNNQEKLNIFIQNNKQII